MAILIGLCHISIYVGISAITSGLCLGVILCGYFLLLFYNEIYPVVFFICSARVLSGFLIGLSGFGITSIVVNYVPLLFFLIRNSSLNHFKYNLPRYKFTAIYTFFILFSFLLNFKIAYPLLQLQIVPLVFIFIYVLFVSKWDNSIEITPFKYLFRLIFLSSLITFLFPNHIEKTNELLSQGYIFGAEADDIILSYKDFFRNEGIFFDPRILGTFAYLYVYILLRCKGSKPIIDIILCLVVIITTISRGAFVCLALVLLGNAKLNFRRIFIYGLFATILVVVATYAISKDDTIETVLSTLDITSEDNALSQRSVFSEYSLKTFEQHPIFGAGLGDLTAPGTKHRNISSNYDVVTDAFVFSLLGEVGIVGFVLFVLSLFELVLKQRKRCSYFLLLGLLIQMMGTDLPNMRLIWFAMIVLISFNSYYDENLIARER